MKYANVYLSCIVGVLLLGWAGTNYTRKSYFCELCGMKRLKEERVWFKIPVHNIESLYQTGYSELYFRGVSSLCSHKWSFVNSQSSGNILNGGENGRGASSYALQMAPVYRKLSCLDKSKIPAFLRALPLKGNITEKERQKIAAITESLIDLEGNISRRQTEEWWAKNHDLFANS
jgi:hypothetical protein